MASDPSKTSIVLRRGAIVLSGGQSRRMGRDKATLPFGDESMLSRVVRIVGQKVDVVCVAAARGQALPPLPSNVVVVRDDVADRGPLGGLLAGLAHLAERVDAVLLVGCDAPLLEPKLIERLFEILGDAQAVAPVDHHHDYPLLAVYRTTIRDVVARRLASDDLAMTSLLDEIRARRVDVETLREVDPELTSLMNVNTTPQYQAALKRVAPVPGVIADPPGR
jgi:molybdopterin-guanine dinucleotide biosynthesis protein A